MRRINKSYGPILIALVLCAVLIAPFSCATTQTGGRLDGAKVDRAITVIQGLERSLLWISPIVCGVVSVTMDPSAAASCEFAQTALRALVSTTDQAVSAYQGSPTSENAQTVLDLTRQLQDAWKVMDAAYKGDPSKLKTLGQTQVRIHPFEWRRGLKRAFYVA